jgi:hypothetical protein
MEDIMLVRILRGEHYGETRHLPQSQEVNLAIMLGDVEVVEEKPATVPLLLDTPRFISTRNSFSDNPQLEMVLGTRREIYFGKPEHASDYFKRMGAAFVVPARTLAQYEAAFKAKVDLPTYDPVRQER